MAASDISLGGLEGSTGLVLPDVCVEPPREGLDISLEITGPRPPPFTFSLVIVILLVGMRTSSASATVKRQ